MALSFRREAPDPAPEALVFAEGFDMAGPLGDDLDQQFGRGHWREAEGEQALEVHGDTAFALVAIASDEPERLEAVARLIRKARDSGLMVLLIFGEVSSRTVHRLLREGVTDFAPYPEPQGALTEALERMRCARTLGPGPAPAQGAPPARQGRVIAVYGVAGGVGASTFAVNLAWELASLTRRQGRRVALLDFNFQYGSVATFLDVPRREAVYELVSEASSLDQTGFAQALSTYRDRMHVLTAPRDSLPLDIVAPGDVAAILGLARQSFDYVVIDMPQALMNWSEQVYDAAADFYGVMETDMRSAQNMFRFLRALKAEGLTLERLRFVLNRAPGFADLSGKARMKRVAASLGIDFSHRLPDGGRAVASACDQGMPLAEAARSNAVRKQIVRVAQHLLATESAEREAEAAAG